MLAAPCIPPATGSVFSCILSCSKGVVHTLRLDATMFRFFAGAGPAVAGWAPSCCYTTCVAGKSSGGGMEGDDGGCPSAPGIPLRSRCARPRPPYAEAKGDGVDACASGGSSVACRAPSPPRAYPACSLRLHAPLSLGAKGAGCLPSLCPSGWTFRPLKRPPARE